MKTRNYSKTTTPEFKLIRAKFICKTSHWVLSVSRNHSLAYFKCLSVRQVSPRVLLYINVLLMFSGKKLNCIEVLGKKGLSKDFPEELTVPVTCLWLLLTLMGQSEHAQWAMSCQ